MIRTLLGVLLAASPAVDAVGAVSPNAEARNISGVWLGATGASYQTDLRPVDGSEAPLKTAAAAEYRRHVDAYERGEPFPDTPSQCLPHGVPRSMTSPYPIHILQTPGQVTIVHESGHNVRLVYMDEPQGRNVRPTFMGHSVGRWEGDTLVIDTVGLDARTWVDEAGKPHSEQFHVTERLRKLPDGRLEDLIALEDPVTFKQSWTARRVFTPRPDLRVLEYICEENLREIDKEAERAP